MPLRSIFITVLIVSLLVSIFLFMFLKGLILREEYVISLQNQIIPLSSQNAIPIKLEHGSLVGSSSEVTLKNPLPIKPQKVKDIEPQQPLANPPQIVKAIYATGWSAGNPKKVKYFIDLIKKTELNAIVIDIKDFSGYVLYNTELEEVKAYNAVEVRIPRLNTLIKQLHDEGIYVIGRLSVFQDPRLALARRDLALQSSSTQSVWKDKLGLAWIDPAAREAWDYNILIAKEALGRGFDEINFDYIRFASDGNLADIIYPFWDKKISRREVIRRFFEHLRKELALAVISADIFGLVTVGADDLGIGQFLENAFPYFDYLAPMVYPSHYASGFLNYKNPAQFPYQVVAYSMTTAVSRLGVYEKKYLELRESTSTPPDKIPPKAMAKFRPWLQDFDLGADYNAEMVTQEIQAVYDAFCSPASGRDAQICNSSSTDSGLGDKFGGWMLWNPSNVYTREALTSD